MWLWPVKMMSAAVKPCPVEQVLGFLQGTEQHQANFSPWGSDKKEERNQRREEEFLKRKTEPTSESKSEVFKCEECGNLKMIWRSTRGKCALLSPEKVSSPGACSKDSSLLAFHIRETIREVETQAEEVSFISALSTTLYIAVPRLSLDRILRLRWSIQRANGKYKDHRVGQLTIHHPVSVAWRVLAQCTNALWWMMWWDQNGLWMYQTGSEEKNKLATKTVNWISSEWHWPVSFSSVDKV